MAENNLKQVWSAGGHVVFGQCAIGSPLVAEAMAGQGYGGVLVDMQHGAIGYDAMLGMMQAIATTSAAPAVRIPWNLPPYIMQALDAGAQMVIAPMINSGAECRAFVDACHYAPRGYRSWGPVRAQFKADNYFRDAAAMTVPVAMIETKDALARAEEIIAVAGLGGIYVGPADLSITLGLTPPGDEPEAVTVKAITDILEIARRRGVAVGTHANTPAFARKMIAAGCQFVVLGVDIGLIADGARDVLASLAAELRRPG
jgi:4-hydroxy-2-oxoheptanedioate aldolase